jgi:predicted dehydrogenase
VSAPRPSVRSAASLDRRRFLAASAAAGIGFPLWLRSARADSPNDRLRLASIGVGGMGAADLGSLASHAKVEVVALCDIDSNRLAEAKANHPGAETFADYREMFAKMADRIDAVNVATPDHTHAPAAMTALNAGKHVYCQKPLTHDVYESRQLRLIAEKTGLVTQMGTQIHSASEYRTAVQWVKGGLIGKVREVHSWSSKTWGYDGPDPVAAPVPDHVAWDLWLGTAPERPYAQGHYHPADWRRWVDFGCGTMGDMGIHILDPVFSALDLGAPKSIVSSSPAPPARSHGLRNQVAYRYDATEYTTDDFRLTWSDGGLMPESADWGLPEGMGLPDQGSVFVGTEATMLLPHIAMPQLFPQEKFANVRLGRVPGGDHYHLWVDACLGGEPTTAHFGYAGPLTESLLLGVIANRFPTQELVWDSETMTIENFSDAQALIRRTYRSGYEVENL